MFSKLTLFGILMLAVLSCISPEKLIKDPSAEKIYFGKYGGFTNSSMDYVLISYEHIYKFENEKYFRSAKISKAQAAQIKSLINDSALATLQLNEPGNMTYYIRITEDGNDREIKWTDQTLNPKIKELYKTLLSSLNQ